VAVPVPVTLKFSRDHQLPLRRIPPWGRSSSILDWIACSASYDAQPTLQRKSQLRLAE
jgi:hypothetical protein